MLVHTRCMGARSSTYTAPVDVPRGVWIALSVFVVGTLGMIISVFVLLWRGWSDVLVATFIASAAAVFISSVWVIIYRIRQKVAPKE